MGTTEVSVLGGVREHAPDEAKVARLSSQLAAAREACEEADDRTMKALKASRVRA